MRKLSVLAGAAVLSAGPALAADLVAKPTFSWTGLYVGGFAGYARSSADATGTLDPNNPFGNSAPVAQPAYNANMSPGLKSSGFTGGGAVGANWQIDAAVFGAEGDFGAFRFLGSATTSATPLGHVNLTSSTSANADWLGTVRWRFGWAIGHSLIYGTVGAAFTNLGSRQTNTYATLGPAGVEAFSISNVRLGVAAGAGWEYMFAPNWSGKIEYLHLDFETLNGAGVVPIQSVNVTHATTFTSEVVRAGINYRFAP
jgi:outer membrane immunogenic protein